MPRWSTGMYRGWLGSPAARRNAEVLFTDDRSRGNSFEAIFCLNEVSFNQRSLWLSTGSGEIDLNGHFEFAPVLELKDIGGQSGPGLGSGRVLVWIFLESQAAN